MKKNLLSLLILALMLGLAVSACAKKEEPAQEAVSNLVDEAAMPAQANALQSDLDEDIFDLDTAQETLAGAADQVQDAAADYADQATDMAQEAVTDASSVLGDTADDMKDQASSLLEASIDSAKETADKVAAAVPAATTPAVPALTADEEAKKKAEDAAAAAKNVATTAVSDLNKIVQ